MITDTELTNLRNMDIKEQIKFLRNGPHDNDLVSFLLDQLETLDVDIEAKLQSVAEELENMTSAYKEARTAIESLETEIDFSNEIDSLSDKFDELYYG